MQMVSTLGDEVCLKLDAEAAATKRDEAQAWRDWILKNPSAGARNAHRFLRLPGEWRSATVLVARGVTSAAPAALIDGYYSKSGGLLNGEEGDVSTAGVDGPWQWRNSEPLAHPPPADLRAAAKTFAADTATAFDGFAPRQFEWVYGPALKALADIIKIIERTGLLRPQLGATAMPMLAKPRGGHRAVTTIVRLYRRMNRLRREEVRRWEDTVDRHYFAAGSGNAPQDAVW